MPPILRSVIAQCYQRGGRSIGSLRNFSSSPVPSAKEWNTLFSCPTFFMFGYAYYTFGEIYNHYPSYKRFMEERQLLIQRMSKLERRDN